MAKPKGKKTSKKNKRKSKRKNQLAEPAEAAKSSKIAKMDITSNIDTMEEEEQGEQDENLRYEDDFGDDYDSEDEMRDKRDVSGDHVMEGTAEAKKGKGKGKAETKTAEKNESVRVWRPSDGIGEDEELVYDPSAYKLIHSFNLPWPSLSFDIIRDSLGEQRVTPPHSLYVVAGTQAAEKKENKVYILKLSDLCKIDHDEDDFLEDEETEDDPIMDHRFVNHTFGGINRIRCLPQEPSTVAVWSSSGVVNILDLKQHFDSFDSPDVDVPSDKHFPSLHKFKGHVEEGYAMDWSPVAPGKLATGDCGKYIYIWNPKESGWAVDLRPLVGHTDSVEDIQWSPVEPSVFVSCSVDKTVKVWDVRDHSSEKLSIDAHDSDVNVISWNKLVQNLLLSGSDDGTFKVWDFRMTEKPYARYEYHDGPITSVEWHPSVDSILSVSGEDNRITIWDLQVEADDAAMDTGDGSEQQFPSQLMFEHFGSEDVKEIHWHPQIKDMVVSTSASGFSVFIPSNMDPIEETE